MRLPLSIRNAVVEELGLLMARQGVIADFQVRDLLVPYITFPPEAMLERWITRQVDDFMRSVRKPDGLRKYISAVVDGNHYWIGANAKLERSVMERASFQIERQLYGSILTLNSMWMESKIQHEGAASENPAEYVSRLSQSDGELLESWERVVQYLLERRVV